MISDLEIVLRLILAALFGGIIGIEREASHRFAGLRTQVLVSVGSALITLTSIYAFSNNGPVDPSRIAAGIVTGIGFLGAGAIIKARAQMVKGLTTAASLWVVAAIGMAVGAGFYLGAGLTTVLIFVVLMFKELDHKFENIFHKYILPPAHGQ